MRIQLRGLKIAATPAIEEHVQRRLRFALGRFAERVGEVKIRFEGVNGPRGGDDMACRLVTRLRSGGTVRVEERCRDLYSAIDRGADRLRHAVGREVARQRRRRTSSLRRAWSPA